MFFFSLTFMEVYKKWCWERMIAQFCQKNYHKLHQPRSALLSLWVFFRSVSCCTGATVGKEHIASITVQTYPHKDSVGRGVEQGQVAAEPVILILNP